MSYKTKRKIAKVVTITVSILLLLVLLWGIMFTVEYFVCSKPHLPIFARYTHTTGGYNSIHHYHGLGYTVAVYGYAPFDSEYDFSCIDITLYNGIKIRPYLVIE